MRGPPRFSLEPRLTPGFACGPFDAHASNLGDDPAAKILSENSFAASAFRRRSLRPSMPSTSSQASAREVSRDVPVGKAPSRCPYPCEANDLSALLTDSESGNRSRRSGSSMIAPSSREKSYSVFMSSRLCSASLMGVCPDGQCRVTGWGQIFGLSPSRGGVQPEWPRHPDSGRPDPRSVEPSVPTAGASRSAFHGPADPWSRGHTRAACGHSRFASKYPFRSRTDAGRAEIKRVVSPRSVCEITRILPECENPIVTKRSSSSECSWSKNVRAFRSENTVGGLHF